MTAVPNSSELSPIYPWNDPPPAVCAALTTWLHATRCPTAQSNAGCFTWINWGQQDQYLYCTSEHRSFESANHDIVAQTWTKPPDPVAATPTCTSHSIQDDGIDCHVSGLGESHVVIFRPAVLSMIFPWTCPSIDVMDQMPSIPFCPYQHSWIFMGVDYFILPNYCISYPLVIYGAIEHCHS